jgi:ring-1,2-phenylacetyl-CoA epoxidase subunit PaaE
VHLSFHPLRIAGRDALADDAVCLTLAVPAELAADYHFEPGQHVALRATLDGREVRRTYSIVSPPASGVLRLGIRVQGPGGLSHHLAHEAAVGDSVDALSPTGRFIRSAGAAAGRCYLGFVAGSGITPVIAIATAVLEREPGSRFVLVYGNRTTARTMFLEDVLALKNRFLGRFALHFVMSREPQEIELFNGRIDGNKVRELAGVLFDPAGVDEVFVCGPGDMSGAVREALHALGSPAPVHFERFTTDGAASTGSTAVRAAATNGGTAVAVVQDGRRRTFTMLESDASVLDAAARAGIELPFSCRAGVCSTCRARVVSGSVTMANNVALEDWELAAGFVLCCQARPSSSQLELSYDDK